MNTTSRAAILLVIGAAALPSSLLAVQEVPLLQAGARIRVWSREVNQGALVGRLLNLHSDTLWLQASSTRPQPLSLAGAERFEVSRGRNPAVLLGGVALGGVLGALIGPAITTEDVRCRLEVGDDLECGQETPDAVIGAAVGAVALGVLSGAIARERWIDVPLDHLRIGVLASLRGGGGLSVSVHFD